MATQRFTYRKNAELPGLTLPWQEETSQGAWTNLDLSTGHTFTLTLTDQSGTVDLTKTTGITGADGSVTVAWAAGELNLDVDVYKLHLRANETATSKDRDYLPRDPIYIVIID